jgi:protein-disulfide isomerase
VHKLKAAAELFTTLSVGAASLVLIWVMVTNGRPTSGRLDHASRIENVEGEALTVPLDNRAVGSASAKLVVVEFSDYQCPFCRSHARETFPLVKQEFIDTGQIAYAFVNLPLEGAHPLAKRAAAAAECAREQNRFPEMHWALFTDQARLEQADLIARAKRLHLNEPRFTACIDSTGADLVSRDLLLAKKQRITATPAFLVGYRDGGRVSVKRRLIGAQHITQFRAVLRELSQALQSATLE